LSPDNASEYEPGSEDISEEPEPVRPDVEDVVGTENSKDSKLRESEGPEDEQEGLAMSRKHPFDVLVASAASSQSSTSKIGKGSSNMKKKKHWLTTTPQTHQAIAEILGESQSSSISRGYHMTDDMNELLRAALRNMKPVGKQSPADMEAGKLPLLKNFNLSSTSDGDRFTLANKHVVTLYEFLLRYTRDQAEQAQIIKEKSPTRRKRKPSPGLSGEGKRRGPITTRSRANARKGKNMVSISASAGVIVDGIVL
jgi:hypothetical protein